MIKRPSCELLQAGTCLILILFSSSNPIALGLWLYTECSRYGVEFLMNTKAVSAKLSNNNEIVSLNVIGSNDKASAIDCNKLVIAAGPWTPATFRTLFPQSSVRFDPVISAGEWFIVENPGFYSEKSIAGV